jgi:hypothetical protein
MARPYSLDLRECVVALIARGETFRPVAAVLDVSAASVVKRSQRFRATGSAAAKAMGVKRPYLLDTSGAFFSAALPQSLICKILDLSFQALPRDIATCHSSLGAKSWGQVWRGGVDAVKDAIGRSEERPSQATGYGTGFSGAGMQASPRTCKIMPASLPTSSPPRRECPPLNE